MRERAARELSAGYRSCPMLKDHIALTAVLRGEPGKREAIEQRMNEYSRQALAVAAGGAKCRVHVQESRRHSRWQAH